MTRPAKTPKPAKPSARRTLKEEQEARANNKVLDSMLIAELFRSHARRIVKRNRYILLLGRIGLFKERAAHAAAENNALMELALRHNQSIREVAFKP